MGRTSTTRRSSWNRVTTGAPDCVAAELREFAGAALVCRTSAPIRAGMKVGVALELPTAPSGATEAERVAFTAVVLDCERTAVGDASDGCEIVLQLLDLPPRARTRLTSWLPATVARTGR